MDFERRNERKKLLFSLGAFLAGLITASLRGSPSADALTRPLAAFGNFLRSLSLSSASGNLWAWALVLLLSALPALGLLWKKRCPADFLLLLCSGEIFAMLYYLVNPTRVSQVLNWMDQATLAKVWALVSAGCTAGTLVCWVLLRFLKVIAKKPAGILPAFLFWAAVICAFALGFSGRQDIQAAVQKLTEGNSQKALIQSSKTMIYVLHTLALIPNLLGVWVIFLAGKLALPLENDPFSEETVALAESISKKTVWIAKVSLLLTVLGNALQLLFFPKLLQVHMEIHIPVLTLMLCAVLMLLCKYFRRAKAVSDDNAAII